MFNFFNRTDSNDYNQILTDLKSKKATLIDIREHQEWNQVHFQCAKHIPLSDLQRGVGLNELKDLVSENKKIYLHCRSGSRVQFAKQMLDQMGFSEVTIIPIGMQEMLQKGFRTAA